MCKMEVLPGFEPGSPDSESEVLTNYTIRPYTPGGTRTHNLALRRGTRYPLRYGGSFACLPSAWTARVWFCLIEPRSGQG